MGPAVKTTRVSFRTFSCIPLKAFSHFSLNADASSFMTLDQCSRLKSFIPGFEVASPNHLTNMLSDHRPQSLTARRCCVSILFLIVQSQHSLKLFGNLEPHFVQTFQDFSTGLLGLELSSGWLKVVIYHVSNLPSSQESILFLSSLLFSTDSPFERSVDDDLCQRRLNPRIKHFNIKENLSAIQLVATS